MSTTIVSTPTWNIKPNPYQPEGRANPSEDICKQFGLSIHQHGMILTPVARRVNGDGYEIGDGWLRLQGYIWLQNHGYEGYEEIRLDEREISDQQMADLVMEANTVRKDLDPIEEAHLFKRYIADFGVTEAKLAKKHNLTQGAVANTMRLLQLPEEIQQKVKGGEISGTHARQLLRLNEHPDMQTEMTKECIARSLSVSSLDNAIQLNLWRSSQSLTPNAGYRSPVFDVSECEGCAFRMKIAAPWGATKKEWRCTKLTCWDRKQEAAEKVLAKETLKKMEKKGDKVLTDKDLSYDRYQDLFGRYNDNHKDLDTPAECKTCGKTSLFVYSHSPDAKPHTVCLDPACYRRKKTKKTKADNKIKKEQDHALTEQLGEVFLNAFEYPTECLRVITRHLIPHMDATCKMDFCKSFKVPTSANGRMDQDATVKKVDTLEIEELLQWAVAATIIPARRRQSYDYSIRLTPEIKRDVAMVTNNMREFEEEVNKFREENCKGCRFLDKAKLNTDEECCINNGWAKRVNDEGNCDGRETPAERAKAEAKPLAEVMAKGEDDIEEE